LVFESKEASEYIQGRPEILVHNGKIFEKMMAKEKITHDEIHAVLRENGVDKISNVKYLILETNGDMSVIKKGKNP
jgi:uncharacterized membrane protein YcaP (DUF421 family)